MKITKTEAGLLFWLSWNCFHCQICSCVIHNKLNLSDVDNWQVRAQHGCALVELRGESGMMVVGGDSGGTRLNDVRFENATIRYNILHHSKEVRTLFVV